jgi:hypothetical protein
MELFIKNINSQQKKYDHKFKDRGLYYFIFDFDNTLTQADTLEIFLSYFKKDTSEVHLSNKVFGDKERINGLQDLFSSLKKHGKILIASRNISPTIINLLQSIDLLKYVDGIYDRNYFTLNPTNNKIKKFIELGWMDNHIFYVDDDKKNHESVFHQKNYLKNKRTKMKYIFKESPTTGIDPVEMKKYIENIVIPFFKN